MLCSVCLPVVVTLYLLGGPSQVFPTSMESQPTITLDDIMTQLTVLTQIVNKVRKDLQVDHERLANLETSREPPKIEEPLLSPQCQP